MTKEEQLGLRDLRYSGIHRTFREDLYFTDVDAIEFNADGVPVAVLELKHGAATRKLRLNTFQIKAQTNLANMAKLPFYIILYYPPLPKGYDNNIHNPESPNYNKQETRKLDWTDSYSENNDPKEWKFDVIKLNDYGTVLQKGVWKEMNLQEYEEFLINLRGVI